ncbi:MAG: peptidoglycan-binding protein [Chitinophagales bacterium]
MKSLMIICSLLAAQFSFGQIFINTGNPNMDKYKQDNPNATIINSTIDTVVKKAATIENTVPEKAKVPVNAAVVAKSASPIRMAAEPTVADLPPNAEPGKCYARCFTPDKYETREEEVVDRPATTRMKPIPATYKTVYDTVVVKAASVRYEAVPPVYETLEEEVMISPASQKWEKGVADAGCLSANPADCQVMCLRDIPAVYKKISRKVLKTPASRTEIPVPAVTKIVPRQVIDVPASQEKIEIPATYKKVSHRELVQKGGYGEWKEILCADKLTSTRILAIQKALKANGYDPGALDNSFGGQTKSALIKYQQDKNLPVGNLNMETLKSLGVE